MLPPPHLHASRPPPGRFPAASQLTSQLVPITSYLLQAATTAVAQAEEQLKAEKRLIASLQQTVSAQSVELAAVESRVVKLFQHAADTAAPASSSSLSPSAGGAADPSMSAIFKDYHLSEEQLNAQLEEELALAVANSLRSWAAELKRAAAAAERQRAAAQAAAAAAPAASSSSSRKRPTTAKAAAAPAASSSSSRKRPTAAESPRGKPAGEAGFRTLDPQEQAQLGAYKRRNPKR